MRAIGFVVDGPLSVQGVSLFTGGNGIVGLGHQSVAAREPMGLHGRAIGQG